MSEPLHLLLVEDSALDADLLVRQLRRAQFEPTWHRVETPDDYLAHLHDDLDVIIADFNLPHFSGLRALELLKERGLDIPFIMVSGIMSEKRAAEAMRHGAVDYLMKDRPERLGFAVAQAVEKSRLRRGVEKARRELEEGERKFRALFDSAHDAIYMLRNGVFADCNRNGQVMYGRTWDQIIGHTPDEFAPPTQPDGRNSREKAIDIIMKAMQGDNQFFEWTSRHANGENVVSEISLSRVEFAGEILLMAVARDVTERRRADEKIADQAALLDKAQDAIAIRDLDGKILFWNKGAERIYGWCRDEVLGHHLVEFIYADPTDLQEIKRHVLEHGEWSGEVHHLTKDQREITIEARWTLLRDNEGHPKSMMCINTDVTEKKSMEAQLMQAQRMESIGTLAGGIAHDLNNILTPILTSIALLKLSPIDHRTRHILDTIETSSQRGADIVRQVLSFARGIKGKRVEIQPKRLLKDIRVLIHDTFPRNIQLNLQQAGETWNVRGDPTQLHQVLLNLSVNARDAMPAGGTLTITAENALLDPATLHHPETNKRWSQSPDTFTSLEKPVSLESSSLGTRKIEPPQADPQGEGSRERIESTPAPSGPEKRKEESDNQSPPTDASLSPQKRGPLPKIHPPSTAPLHPNSSELQKPRPKTGTLSPTLPNHHLPTEPTPRRLSPTKSQPLRLLPRKEGKYVRLTITDSGAGITHQQLDHIFEPFYTTKEVGQGTGLGLSTVLAIVKSHDGFVDVHSIPGTGTTFEVFLPALEPSAAPTPEPRPTSGTLPRGAGETILIVDDEPSILAITSDTLDAFGYRTITANDGAEAIATYARRQDEIAAVLTDMTMPVMDGPATIRHLLEINPALRIIASSGFITRTGTNTAAVAGRKHFLSKPYTAETLLKTVRAALDD